MGGRMVAQFGMSTPMGEVVHRPDSSWLRELMLHAGPEFWNAGGGDAKVEHGLAWIILIFHEQYGFSMDYRDPSEDCTYCPWMQDGHGRPVEVTTGGSSFFLPEAMFVPRDLAFAVVEEFCRTGRRSDKIRWLPATDVRWDPEAGKPLVLG
jgi:hypothetical protein